MFMSNFYKATLLAIGTLVCLPSLTALPVSAQAPSLGNGIICVARGKTTQGNKIYLYTSVIDYNSIQKKQPVSVTISQSMATVDAEELVDLRIEKYSKMGAVGGV